MLMFPTGTHLARTVESISTVCLCEKHLNFETRTHPKYTRLSYRSRHASVRVTTGVTRKQAVGLLAI